MIASLVTGISLTVFVIQTMARRSARDARSPVRDGERDERGGRDGERADRAHAARSRGDPVERDERGNRADRGSRRAGGAVARKGRFGGGARGRGSARRVDGVRDAGATPPPSAAPTAAPAAAPPSPAQPAPSPAPAAPPSDEAYNPSNATVDVGSVSPNNVNGDAVRSAVRGASLTRCYRDALRARGRRAFGSATVSLSIDETGRIDGAILTGADWLPEMIRCVQGSMSGLQLRPGSVESGGGTADVWLSFRAP